MQNSDSDRLDAHGRRAQVVSPDTSSRVPSAFCILHSALPLIRLLFRFTLVGLLVLEPAHAQSVRDHTRLDPAHRTTVTEAQATELTLTVTPVAVRPLQIWIRAAGVIDAARRTITAELPAAQGRRLRVGQRVRAFSPESRSRMHQATLAQVRPRGEMVVFTASLMGQAPEKSRHYVLEVVTEDGDFLSVPNEAIIETGGKTVVYLEEGEGRYALREIKPGVQGELFTEVLDGVKAGEKVVTIGSFFIDAEHKLKGS